MATSQRQSSQGGLKYKAACRSLFVKVLPLVVLLGMGTFAQAQIQWQFHTIDEFNGAANDNVDLTKWVPGDVTPLYWGTGSPDAVTYCKRGSTLNTCPYTTAYPYVLDGGGHLVIHAVDTGHTRSVAAVGGATNEEVYNSARLESINDSTHRFQYGRIEARIQVPKGQGAWPAFWLLGSNYNKAFSNPDSLPPIAWPEVGEIDILEQWSVKSDAADLSPLKQNQGSWHGPKSATDLGDSILDQGATFTTGSVDLGDDFHTYAIDWLPGEVDFYLDGALYGRRSPALMATGEIWELDARYQYPVLNLDVGTTHTYPPATSAVNDYPITSGTDRTPADLLMTVDYVRHYSYLLAGQTLPAFYGDADLGGGGPDTGSDYSGGTFTIIGSGNGFDPSGATSTTVPDDQLHYVYRALTADGTYSVKVGAQTGNLTTKAGGGLMIRDGRADYAQFVSTWISPDNVVHFQSRVSSAALSSATYGSCGPYLRIVKSGTTFTGGCSANGTTWTATGTVNITFSNHELAGLVAFSGGNPVGSNNFADVLNTVTLTNFSTPSGRAAWDGNAPAVPQLPYKGVVPPTLIQAENFDVGGQGSAYNTTGSNTTFYRVKENVYIDHCQDYTTTGAHGTPVGGFMVGQTHAGQWLNYTINVTTPGTYKIRTRVAADGGGGTFHYTLDGATVGGSSLTVPDTGSWTDSWQTVTSSSINFSTAGIHTLSLVLDAEQSGGGVANFDLFTIAP